MRITVKTTEKEKDVIFTFLCVVRILVMTPLLLLGYVYILIMWMFGTKNAVDKTISYWNAIAFNKED